MHGRVVGRAFGAAVPGLTVGVVAVTVSLAVGLVVLVVIRDEVVEREAVMTAEEVDRVQRAAIVVEVVAAADPRRQRRGHIQIAAPELPDIVPIAAVPVRPPALTREGANLVEPGRIPGLGDELDVAKQ